MTFDLARLILAILAIVGLLLLSGWIVSPFFTIIIWSLMIVVSTWPLMLRLQSLLHGRRALAVTAMTLMILAVFIVPVALALNTILDHMDTIVDGARRVALFQMPPAPDWLAQVPIVGDSAVGAWNRLREAGLDSLVQELAPYADDAAQFAIAQLGDLGLLLVHILLTVVVSAVMFAQGEEGAHRLMLLARRVGGEHGAEAIELATAAIRAVALGVVVTALAQALTAGIGLYMAGIPFAGLLTALALLLCIAQLGAAPVLIPAAIWLFWSGETGWGVFLLLWTVLVVTMDNFIRPLLIRQGADLPLLLIFAGVIGGLLSMGLVGLFVGPVVLAVTWRLFEAWVGLREPLPANSSPRDSAATERESAPRP